MVSRQDGSEGISCFPPAGGMARWNFGLCLLAVFTVCALCFRPDCVEAWQGTVVRVVDGDTIEVSNCADKVVRIHLYGVEAPGSRHFHGDESASYCASLVQGRSVQVMNVGRDWLGRMRSLVWIDGKSVNEEMVRAGCAWVSNRHGLSPTCRRWASVEDAARSRKAGLWSELDALVAHGVVPELPASCPVF